MFYDISEPDENDYQRLITGSGIEKSGGTEIAHACLLRGENWKMKCFEVRSAGSLFEFRIVLEYHVIIALLSQ